VNHRLGSLVFALVVGLAIAWYAYDRVTDPLPAQQREIEEAVVLEARAWLVEMLMAGPALEISDPLDRDRVAGKVYVYPVEGGWEISGHYRRGEGQGWHPWLMQLDGDRKLRSLAVRDPDPGLAARAAADDRLTVTP